MISRLSLPSLLAALLLLGIGATTAPAALVDYTGFAWETGGILPSNPGDQLNAVAIAVDIDPLFGANFPTNEATLVISGLVSTGQFDSAGTWVVAYVGGELALYADPSNDHDFGVAPASFTNGELLFQGAFTNFTLFVFSNGSGAFEGSLDGIGGSALAGACIECAYTFAGTFSTANGAQIPDGYDLQIDGTLEVDSAVSIDQAQSWGAVKNLFVD